MASPILATILRANAASCLGFGVLFITAPGPVAAFLGATPEPVLTAVGAGLMLNGLHLLVASFRRPARPVEIIWFSLGDFGWWLATLGLIAAGIWITTPGGITAALSVAAVVALLGAAQLFQLGLARSGLSTRAHWARIGRSWLALPLWVKTWLFALNVAFLVSPVFLPWSAAAAVLLAYVASGPLLLGFAVAAGGLTRAMGLAHLVPWTPMLVWLVVDWPAPAADPAALIYAGCLALMTAICLGFDLYDLGRWLRDEREILLAGPPDGLSE